LRLIFTQLRLNSDAIASDLGRNCVGFWAQLRHESSQTRESSQTDPSYACDEVLVNGAQLKLQMSFSGRPRIWRCSPVDVDCVFETSFETGNEV
jgi:hypothetical protein